MNVAPLISVPVPGSGAIPACAGVTVAEETGVGVTVWVAVAVRVGVDQCWSAASSVSVAVTEAAEDAVVAVRTQKVAEAPGAIGVEIPGQVGGAAQVPVAAVSGGVVGQLLIPLASGQTATATISSPVPEAANLAVAVLSGSAPVFVTVTPLTIEAVLDVSVVDRSENPERLVATVPDPTEPEAPTDVLHHACPAPARPNVSTTASASVRPARNVRRLFMTGSR